MEFENNIKVIGKGIYITLIGIVISKILAYVYRIIIARNGVELYGTFSLGLALASLLITLSLFGVHSGVLRYIPYLLGKKQNEKINGLIKTALFIALPISIIVALIIYFKASFISNNIFHIKELEIVIKILAIVIPLDVIRNIFFNASRAFKKPEYEVFSKTLIENIVKIVLTAALLLLGYGLFGISVAYLFGILISLVMLFVLIKKNLNIKIQDIIKADYYSRKELIKYSLPLMLSAFILIAFWDITNLILGYLRNVTEVGIYNAVVPTANLLYIIPNAILTLFIPVIGGLYSKNKFIELKQLSRTVLKYIFMINLLLLGFFICFSNKILAVLFGNEYSSGGLALIILGIGCFIFYLSLPQNHILIVYKKTKTIFYISLIGIIIHLVLSFFLIKTHGFIGATIAMTTAFAFIFLTTLLYLYKKIKINLITKTYIKIILSISISTIIIKQASLLIEINPIIDLAIGGIGLFLIYAFFIWVTKSLNKNDIIIIKIIQEKLGIKSKLLNKIINQFDSQ